MRTREVAVGWASAWLSASAFAQAGASSDLAPGVQIQRLQQQQLEAIASAGGVADWADASAGMTRALSEGGMPEGKLELSFGSSRSKSTYTQDSTLHNGSRIKGGGKIALVATGDKAAGQGNVTIEGSDVVGKDVFLAATNKVKLLNSTDSERVRSTNESQSASAGVSFGTGGWGVSAAASRGRGHANSDATMRNNTHIVASNTATIVSGGDTDIVGANVSAKKVMADVGGNLNIASVQDTVRSTAQQRSSGGGFSVSQLGGGSASFSMQNGRASGSYAGVSEQSGIQAGEGGFDIAVKGNTDLKGAYIASTAAPEKNRLTTGTLSFSDIENHSDYRTRSAGGSAGGGVGNGGNNYATHGPTTGRNPGGALPVVVSESASGAALTKSAVSAGSITIVDEANQRQDVAMLSRDVTDLNGTVGKLPDLQNALAGQSDLVDAAQAGAETIAKQIGKYAEHKETQAEDAAKAETDPERRAQYEREARGWAEGGKERVGLHVAGGVLTGGLTAGALGAVGGATGAGLSAMLAPKFDEFARSIKDAGPTGNGDVDQLLGNVASNLLAGGVGALVGGPTGALTSAATDRFNRQLHPDERQWAKENAESFAKHYQEKTGKVVTVEQALEMLLGTGYRLVDAVASKGPGGDAVAVAYISDNGGDLFRATAAEYKDPFLYGNEDRSLTPEQRALPGAVANPALGLGIGVSVAGGLAIAAAAPQVGAIVAAGGKYAADLFAGYKAAQAAYSLTTGALTGAGVSAGLYTFTAASAAALAKFQGDDAATAFDQRFSLLGLGTAATVGAANGMLGTSMFKWADIPNKITNVSTVPGAVIRINGVAQGQAASRAAQAAVNQHEEKK